MKNVYRFYCKTARTIAMLSIGHLIGLTVASAQTPDYSTAHYIPSNMGKLMPTGTNYANMREKTSFAFTNNDPATRLLSRVEMTDFFAGSGNGAVELTWRVDWEPDLKRYEIEYSKDNINYQQVGIVNAGTYQNGRAYTFRHTPVNARDRIFYRLRMVDLSGRYDYSPVLSLIVAGNAVNYVFPTIVNAGMVSLYLNEAFETVQIVDMQGRILQSQYLNGRTGRIDISLTKPAKGICVVRVLGQEQHNQPRKSIVQKIFIQ
jgi:hypothetical protein